MLVPNELFYIFLCVLQDFALARPLLFDMCGLMDFSCPFIPLSQWGVTKWGSVFCLYSSPQLFPIVETLENNDLIVSTYSKQNKEIQAFCFNFFYSSGREVIKNLSKTCHLLPLLSKVTCSVISCSFSVLQMIFYFFLYNKHFLQGAHGVILSLLCYDLCLCRSHCSVPALRQCLEELASHWTSVASSLQLWSSDGANSTSTNK